MDCILLGLAVGDGDTTAGDLNEEDDSVDVVDEVVEMGGRLGTNDGKAALLAQGDGGADDVGVRLKYSIPRNPASSMCSKLPLSLIADLPSHEGVSCCKPDRIQLGASSSISSLTSGISSPA